MKDVLQQTQAWHATGQPIAVATVVDTWGSAPRPVGSKLVATADGRFAGSVSAGCVEGAVLEQCAVVIKTGQSKLLTFGVADEDAWEVGLACGGTIRVWVEPFDLWEPVFAPLAEAIEADRSIALVSAMTEGAATGASKLLVSSTGETTGSLAMAPEQETVIAATASERLVHGDNGMLETAAGPSLFVEVYPRPPRLIIVGAVHIAAPLIDLAHTMGFVTILVDPREAFATQERFPRADEIIRAWPEDALPGLELDDNAHIAILTHDPKIDDPALKIALVSGARYIGALGSTRTAKARLERLRAAGLDEASLARLHAPIGLNLGGRSADEVALSIMAEIVQVRNQAVQLFRQS